MSSPIIESLATVTMNPTIDRIIEVPGFRIGGHLRAHLRSRLPAGKAFNVSRAMAALGIRSLAAGWVGAESQDLFEQAARRARVDARFTPIAGLTRENITLIDPSGPTETHIREAGPDVTDDDVQRLENALTELAGPGTVLVFTGSCAPGLTPLRFGRLLETCIDRGARIVIDGSGEPLRVAASKPIWMLKPNLLELGELLGHELRDDSAVLDAGRQLHTRIPIVLITLGERGAYCFANNQVLHGRVSLPPDQVRSTVGCGDAMLAGFLAGLCVPDGTVESAFRQSLAVSAASALTDQPAVFALPDVNSLARSVELADLAT